MSALWPPGQSKRYAARTDEVAGMAGLEPASEGVKVPCLTTWLHPYIRGDKRTGKGRSRSSGPPAYKCGVGKGTRTLDTRNHNPVL